MDAEMAALDRLRDLLEALISRDPLSGRCRVPLSVKSSPATARNWKS